MRLENDAQGGVVCTDAVLQPLDAVTFDRYVKRAEAGEPLAFDHFDDRKVDLTRAIGSGLDFPWLHDDVRRRVTDFENHDRRDVLGKCVLDAGTPDEASFTANLDLGWAFDDAAKGDLYRNVVAHETHVIEIDCVDLTLDEYVGRYESVPNPPGEAGQQRWNQCAEQAFSDVRDRFLALMHTPRSREIVPPTRCACYKLPELVESVYRAPESAEPVRRAPHVPSEEPSTEESFSL
jgi:hypothetical protein